MKESMPAISRLMLNEGEALRKKGVRPQSLALIFKSAIEFHGGTMDCMGKSTRGLVDL